LIDGNCCSSSEEEDDEDDELIMNIGGGIIPTLPASICLTACSTGRYIVVVVEFEISDAEELRGVVVVFLLDDGSIPTLPVD
jgi:hypothetical protein